MRRVLAAAALVAGMALPGPLAAQPVPDVLDGTRYGRLDAPGLTVRFAARDSLVAERVLTFLMDQTELPGLPRPDDVTVVLAHTPRVLDELTGGVVPEWRAGVAVPSRRLLVVPTGEGPRVLDTEGRRVLRHEWAHLALHAWLGPLRVPRWFDEGYAQWASAGFDATEAWRLRILLATGNAPSLDSLTLAWPRSRVDAGAAYLLSASAVTFLLGESGTRGLVLFLERWRRQSSFESAFRETFGVTTAQFEEDWRRHVRDRYGWLFVLSHSTVFWMALALVLLVMVRVRQRYNRERMAQLRADEVPDQPAFWNIPPADPGSPQGDSGVENP